MKDEAIDTSDIPGLDAEFFQLAKIKNAPKRADLQSIFEKFTGFLNIRFDNERKLTDKSSLPHSIRKPGNPEA